MARNPVTGVCHLCGGYGKLSFEHVPPKAAFNHLPTMRLELSETFHLEREGETRGRKARKGAGDFTLCERCNNNTGGWYARDYADFCYQAADYILSNDGAPALIYPYYIFPLRIIKQIITMVASVEGEHFSQSDSELTTFVLDRDRRYLAPHYRVFLYFNLEGVRRRVGRGVTKVHLFDSFRTQQVVEVSHFPFGFVFTSDGTRPADNLVEITHFSRYEYDVFEVIQLQLPDLPTHLGIPLDYRSREEIEEQARRSLEEFPDG